MAWDRPAGWVPPEEQRAAEETAAKMAERRELVDRQSAALGDAIHDGFAMVAAAILAASDHGIEAVVERYNEARFGPRYDDHGEPIRSEPEEQPPAAPVEDGIEEILDDTIVNDDSPTHMCPTPPPDVTRSYGETWRCEVCGALWAWMGDPNDPTKRAGWICGDGRIAPP
jgi:hypothetical protein